MDRLREDFVEKDMDTGMEGENANSKENGAHHPSEDDGRRIANMNIEGMPWYTKEISEEERIRRAMEPTLNGRETRKLIFSALGASLLVGLVFIIGLALFVCFCLYVWFD